LTIGPRTAGLAQIVAGPFLAGRNNQG